MAAIKLQILLRRTVEGDELNRIEALLAELGATVTARGAVTLSATISSENFEKTFARRFQGRSGFSSNSEMGAVLRTPSSLTDYVASISETPLHTPMSD